MMIPIVLALLMAAWIGVVSAQERTGQILKELINAVEKEVAVMEAKAQGYVKERESLLKEFALTAQATDQERNPLKREHLRVELLVLNAKMNKGSLEQVGAYLGTISSILPKLRQIKHELTAGRPGLREPLEVHQQKVSIFLTNAALLLTELKETGPTANQGEITALENTLVGVLGVLESPLTGSPREAGQIDQAIRELNEAFAQFITVQRLLERERAALKIENYAAIARLVLLRLGQGLDVRSIPLAAGSMRREIADRVKKMQELRRESPFSGGTQDGQPALHPDDVQALKRIRQGKIVPKTP